MVEDQDLVTWSSDYLDEDASYLRLARAARVVLITLITLVSAGVLALVGYLITSGGEAPAADTGVR
jgi:hypothetical protein